MYNSENIQVLENLYTHRAGDGDGLKIGLVIQGGGMRGAFGAGVASVLVDLGLSNSFDVIHASSSGCTTGAYMLSRQTAAGSSIYKENISRFRFIKPWRIKKAMNLDYLFDVLVAKKKPLDVDTVHCSPTVLKMYVTDYESGQSKYFTNHQNVDLLLAMKASCAYPNHFPPVKINNKLYFDGNIATILPIEQAIADRCTDILVISTVPENHVEPHQSKSHQVYIAMMSTKYSIDFKEIRKKRVDLYNHSLDIAFGREIPDQNVRIYTIAPDYKIANVSVRAKTITKFLEHGREKAKKIFEDALAS